MTGWFYGETLSTDPLHVRDELLASWINPKYFDETAQKEIRAKFSSSSDLRSDRFFLFLNRSFTLKLLSPVLA